MSAALSGLRRIIRIAYQAKSLIKEIGIQVERYEEYVNRGLYRSLGLTSAKVPLVYSSVLIRNWKSFQKLGVQSVSAPNMWHTTVSLDQPVSIGEYQFAKSPEEPTVLHLAANPNKPGRPRKQLHKAGWHQLSQTSWEQIEVETRRELARILGPGGFDPAAEILGITVNRWPHGYAYTYDSISDPDVPDEQRPHVIGRQPFGRITIANSDSGAGAFINEAIDQGRRAIDELLRRNGLM